MKIKQGKHIFDTTLEQEDWKALLTILFKDLLYHFIYPVFFNIIPNNIQYEIEKEQTKLEYRPSNNKLAIMFNEKK